MPSGNGNSTKWITVNGAHIPIEGGETKRQAVNKMRQKQNTLEIYADPKGNSKVQRLLERFDREFSNEPFMVTKRGYSGITPQNPEKRRLYTRLLKRLDDEIEKDPKVKTKTKLVEDKSIYAMDAYKDVIAGIRSQIGKKNPVYNFTVPKNFPKEDIPALKAAIAVLIDHEERAYMQKKRKKLSMDAFYAGVRRAYDELSTAEKILYPLGLIGASYGIYKANGGIAKKLQKAYPKLHTIPAHSISGGITGGLLGGTAGAGLAYGLSKMYNKPFVGSISPLMAGLFGALGAGFGTLQGADNYLDKKYPKYPLSINNQNKRRK